MQRILWRHFRWNTLSLFSSALVTVQHSVHLSLEPVHSRSPNHTQKISIQKTKEADNYTIKKHLHWQWQCVLLKHVCSKKCRDYYQVITNNNHFNHITVIFFLLWSFLSLIITVNLEHFKYCNQPRHLHYSHLSYHHLKHNYIINVITGTAIWNCLPIKLKKNNILFKKDLKV